MRQNPETSKAAADKLVKNIHRETRPGNRLPLNPSGRGGRSPRETELSIPEQDIS